MSLVWMLGAKPMRWKGIIIAFLIIGFFNCQGQQQFETFLKELGNDKAENFLNLKTSFENSLASSYPSLKTLGERTQAFLNEYQWTIHLERFYWQNSDSLKAIELLNELERSGLRKDIFLTSSELDDYEKFNIEQFIPEPSEVGPTIDLGELEDDFEDILPAYELTEDQKRANEERERKFQEYLRKRPNINSNGLFFYALGKSMQTDTIFMDYVKLITLEVEPSPSLMCSNYLNNFSLDELELWYNQIPLIIHFYYYDLLHRYVVSR